MADHWAMGGEGAADVARAVVKTIESGRSKLKLLYPDEMPLLEKIRTIAREIYRAKDIAVDKSIRDQLASFEAMGYGKLPVCIAKTQFSFSTNPDLKGAPTDHVIPVREVRLSAGAEFIVAVCGDIMTMPGLPKVPAADSIDVGTDGKIVGPVLNGGANAPKCGQECRIERCETSHKIFAPAGQATAGRRHYSPGMNTRPNCPPSRAAAPPASRRGARLDPRALEEVRALLGDRPRRRDLLIEHLHLLQDRYGHLSAAHLAALAAEMKLAQAEVYEVATFYAHFDVVKDGPPPPAITVRVCDSLSCAMAGADKLLADLPRQLGANVRVMRAPCVGACDRAPVAAVGHVQVMKATPAAIGAAVAAHLHAHAYKTPQDFAAYRADGGYALLAIMPLRPAQPRRRDQGGERCRAARARRRRVPHRAQMDAGAGGARDRA